jgi:NADPH:quinone reductase-like Zn-dependent oxidoreductase
MSKAILFHSLGGPEVLKLEEAPAREPGPNEVKLRVQAVGLNRAELMYMGGHYFEQPALPSRLGYEAAGVVEAVGPGVDASWVGKQVATMPGYSMNKYGALAEEAIVPLTSLGEYPSSLSPIEGAAIWMKYGTAYGALVMHAKIGPGDYVLITAASSSVGLVAIQIAKAEGAKSIATTRTSAKRNELLALGADFVIASEEEDLPARVAEITAGKGARVIFDCIGGPFIETLAAAAARGGVIFEYGALSMQPTPFPTRTAMGKGLSVVGYTLMEIATHPEKLKTCLDYITARLADGRFHPHIAKTFPFAQSVEAYQYLASNAQVGKVVITVP